MLSQMQLIDDFFLPSELKEKTTEEKYTYLRKKYNSGSRYILLNNSKVFGPYPKPDVPWDISEAQKIATYNSEVTKVLSWVNVNVVIKLDIIDYKTMGVLIRIATGMLNKCNIPKEIQIMFHDNMVKNLQTEYNNVILSTLPF